MNPPALARNEGRTALWNAGIEAFSAILDHPFLRGLADGSLPRERFRHYVEQDRLYLAEFGRGLALLAARAPDETVRGTLCRQVNGAIEVERALHAQFAKAWPAADEPRTASPTTLLYTSFLLTSVHGGSFAEGLCAHLPCYWIYGEVGLELSKHRSPDPLYRQWIAAYGDPAFQTVVEEALEIFDGQWARLDPETRSRCLARYRTAARLEWRFWNAAWSLEDWSLVPTDPR